MRLHPLWLGPGLTARNILWIPSRLPMSAKPDAPAAIRGFTTRCSPVGMPGPCDAVGT